ncbi:hypothetical protein ATCC90586_002157 [Pythium insidiosum]|nr:hypothetical protein ATCC90586_002157 [Pythium insidiosum]
MPMETRSQARKETHDGHAGDDSARLLEAFESQCRIELTASSEELQSTGATSTRSRSNGTSPTPPPSITSSDAFLEDIVAMVNDVYAALGDAQTESTYQRALQVELQRRGVTCVAETSIPIVYRGSCIGSRRADLIVELADAAKTRCILELKAVQSLSSENLRQLKYYMTHFHVPLGLLINFPKRQSFPDVDDERIKFDFVVTSLQGGVSLRDSVARRTRAAMEPEIFSVTNALISAAP